MGGAVGSLLVRYWLDLPRYKKLAIGLTLTAIAGAVLALIT